MNIDTGFSKGVFFFQNVRVHKRRAVVKKTNSLGHIFRIQSVHKASHAVYPSVSFLVNQSVTFHT